VRKKVRVWCESKDYDCLHESQTEKGREEKIFQKNIEFPGRLGPPLANYKNKSLKLQLALPFSMDIIIVMS